MHRMSATRHNARMASEEHDVVIVGGGIAGLAAALEARASGASVLVVERDDALGGSAATSLGMVVASQTAEQAKHGIVDRPEDHWADLRFASGSARSQRADVALRVLCDAMPDAMRWLAGLGVVLHGPLAEPSQRRARRHVVLPDASSLVARLAQRARRDGVAIETGRRVVGLVAEGARVVGVAIGARGEESTRIAHRAVVLATGDRAVDGDACGDGVRLASAVGAAVCHGASSSDERGGIAWRFVGARRATNVVPPSTWRWAMNHGAAPFARRRLLARASVVAPSTQLVDDGARLVDARGDAIDVPDGRAYLVLDGLVASRYAKAPHYAALASGAGLVVLDDLVRARPDLAHRASSLAALAERLSMDRATLEASVRARRAAQARAPFIALGPIASVRVHGPLAIATDASHRVLDARGGAIDGLCAAGTDARAALALDDDALCLSWAFVSGRRAGRIAAGRHETPDERSGT